jgi:hypothetical protein
VSKDDCLKSYSFSSPNLSIYVKHKVLFETVNLELSFLSILITLLVNVTPSEKSFP